MSPIGQLLTEMLDELPLSVRDGDEAVHVSSVDLALPVETRIGKDGTLMATAPRGRLATGFDPQLGMLTVSFERSDG